MGNITISLKNGTPTITQTPNPYVLAYHAKTTINVGSGFPSDSKISNITFFDNATVNGRDAKGTEIGSWSRGEPTLQPSSDLNVTQNSNSIEVEDVTTKTHDFKVWYSLQVSHGRDNWFADPEMIVKERTTERVE